MSKNTVIGKNQLIEQISKEVKLTKAQIESVITSFLGEIKKDLIKGNEIRLLGYFSFKTSMTSPRTAMNLQTKARMNIPAKRVPKCKFSVNLKNEISGKA
jgi:DNA-binding protein HU-beta